LNKPANAPHDDVSAPLTPPQRALIPVPDAPRAQCIQKPLQYVCDFQANQNSAPKGLQPPTVTESAKEDEGRDEDIEGEVTLVVDVGDIEPLELKSLVDAKHHPDWPHWEQAICEELKTLEDEGMWTLVDPPHGANIVGSKWVFHLKHDMLGHTVHYKARLVAQGFSQVEGVDYYDTYTPVEKLASLHTILALTIHHDLELHQIDIKGTDLNGELTDDEVIYMQQPPGHPYPNSSRKVL
jgi:hypothetical protein